MNELEKLGKNLFWDEKTGLMLEYDGMDMDEKYLKERLPEIDRAISAMEKLEAGAIANVDEDRMVGHYWLRAPELAPDEGLKQEILDAQAQVKEFADQVLEGKVLSQGGKKFKNAMVAGMGGSSLGPAFIYDALHLGAEGLKLYFLDNTDPEGMDSIFCQVEEELDETLLVVISKSGGTVETRNSMLEAEDFYKARGLNPGSHQVFVTGVGSKLEEYGRQQNALGIFPMWDWVGGRTSVMSAVGLLPLRLAGIDTDSLLRGAADCDVLGRNRELRRNPAAILAQGWYRASGGQGGTSMVILPYKDSLVLFGKYLQQLVMESLGKEFDRDGRKVNQGLAVFGNKGSADQHSYVQQLVAGPGNVFTTFIQVLRDRPGACESLKVGEDSTSGDYLNAFMLGTKKALEDHGKLTMTLTVADDTAYSIGALIALYERAVGIYAEFININAYHQPAVEFGKKAAGSLIELKNRVYGFLEEAGFGSEYTAVELASATSAQDQAADLFRVLLHLAANDPTVQMEPAENLVESRFCLVKGQ